MSNIAVKTCAHIYTLKNNIKAKRLVLLELNTHKTPTRMIKLLKIYDSRTNQ